MADASVAPSKADAEMAGTDLTKPHSLHNLFPKWQGYLSLLLLLGNIGLQVYSHTEISLVVRANLNPSAFSGASSGTTGCSNDDATFAAYWTGGADADVYRAVARCILSYSFSGNKPAAEACLRGPATAYVGGTECVDCYTDVMQCAFDNCAGACSGSLSGTLQQGCVDCVSPTCGPALEICVGLPVAASAGTVRRRMLDYVVENTHGGRKASAMRRETQATLADAGELYDVYAISFVDSVRDTWEADAKLVAVLLTILSGIWPYAKNVIMFVAWFVPMTVERRSSVLKNLTRLAKWSLVDVFVIVIILSGLGLNEETLSGSVLGALTPRLVLVAESRSAIYTFCLAAIWDLAQGEWMRTKHLHVAEQLKPIPHAGLGSQTLVSAVPLRDGTLMCSTDGKWTLGLTAIVQLLLVAAGTAVTCVTFSTIGDIYGKHFVAGEGPVLEYNVYTIATALLDAERLEVSVSVPGTYFLVAVFILCAAVIPLWMFSGFMLVLFVPESVLCGGRRKWFRLFCETLDVVGGFACLDVFLVSLLVTMLEWDRFVTAALSLLTEIVSSDCDDPCLATDTEPGAGVWLMAAAVPIGWFLELFFSYAYAEVFEPAEQTWIGPKIFNGCLPASGCTRPRPGEA